MLIDRDKFESFNKFKIESQIDGLKTQYKEYQTDKTTQIVVPPNYGTKSYEKDPNSPKNNIYVQKTKPRISDDQMYDPKNYAVTLRNTYADL